MNQYEYTHKLIDSGMVFGETEAYLELLNEMGAEGWELVPITQQCVETNSITGRQTMTMMLVFKRSVLLMSFKEEESS